jgi:phage shock protein C
MTGPGSPGREPPLNFRIYAMTNYALDKPNAKLLGVCAGLARATGWDALVIRLGAVVATLFLVGPLAILAYLLTAWLADKS